MASKRRIGGLLVLVAVAATVAVGWSWSRSTPEWYGEGPAASEAPAQEKGRPAARAPASADSLLRSLRINGRVVVDGEDLAQLATEALSGTPDGREFLRVSRGLEGQVREGFVEVGGVFDLSALDMGALTPGTRDVFAKLRLFAPFLLAGERYLAVRGTPEEIDGKLGFAPGATLRIGGLGLPLDMIGLFTSGDDQGRPSLELPDLRVTRVEVGADRVTVEAETAP
jgi:hypothetical protein